MRWLCLVLGLTMLSGCASRRLLALETQVLRQENDELRTELAELRERGWDPENYSRMASLDQVGRYLDRSGFNWAWGPEQAFIRMDFEGRNTRFAVTVQYFEPADIIYIATRDYLSLDDAQSPETVVLLMVQMATINYDLLFGKFQLNPETGDLVLSAELQVASGLGYEAFRAALEGVLTAADTHYPRLEQVASGTGL